MATTFSHPSHGACQASGSQSRFSRAPHGRVTQLRGLLVALLYLEKYEQLAPKNPSPEISQSLPQDVAWVAIRDLRTKMTGVWNKLETQMRIYKGREMNKLYKDCGGNAEGLYLFGLHVEQVAQQGELPRDLSSVFARMALSNSMSLHLTEQHPQICNFAITDSLLWGDGLSSSDQKILENLSKAIWPNLDQPPYLPTNSQGPLTPHQYTEYGQPQPYLLPIENSLAAQSHSAGQQGSTANSGFDACSWTTSIPAANMTTYGLDAQSTQPQMLKPPKELIQYSLLGSQFGAPWQEMADPNAMGLVSSQKLASGLGTGSGPQLPYENATSQAQSRRTVTNACGLEGDGLAQGTFDFLDHLGDLPHDLFVKKVITKDPLDMERRDILIDREIESFIRPLLSSRREHGWNLHCQAIVAVAETFLRRQCFHDLEEAADFMVLKLGRAVFPDNSSSYRALCNKVRATQAKASLPAEQGNKRKRSAAVYPCPECRVVIQGRRLNLTRHMKKAHPNEISGNLPQDHEI
ncbi:hypothetical protein B0T10DRAFT_579233 [Thelonectria olida]|uniref:Uncharacterized protein n=1 Tax=Thelonectria olida TaxID=1576542 RepID=A0A9P8W1F8_9HYPO|nr:hypothetical protein B0T10DRAFT_579233 [Thelonectria olida]